MRGYLLHIRQRSVQVAVPELNGPQLVVNRLPRHASVARGPLRLQLRHLLDVANRLAAIAQRRVHSRLLETQQVVTRKSGDQTLHQRQSLGGLAFAAVDGGQEDLRFDTIERTARRNLFHGMDAVLLVAAEADRSEERRVGKECRSRW